ncbi:MAG: ATP-binding protein [Blastocatellia bacterium]
MTISFDSRTLVRVRIEQALRGRELARLGDMLDRGKPALAVVSGEDGLGKSSLLRAFQFAGSEKKWGVVPSDALSVLSVKPDLTIEDFCTEITGMLGLGPEDGVGRSHPQFDGPAHRSRPRFHPLVEQLVHRPALLLLDGYEPAEGFAAWFAGAFLDELRRSGAPVVVVVADRPANVAGLIPLADEHFALAPPDKASIRETLERLAGQLDPPMEMPELNVYLAEMTEQPALLRYLMRALLTEKADVKK